MLLQLGAFDGGSTNADFLRPFLRGYLCAGWVHDAGNGLGCWYNGDVGQSCNQVCAPHGGFDPVSSRHIGNTAGMHFWPAKADGSVWQSVECSSTDNDTNWRADGNIPDGDFTAAVCHLSCSCRF